ncbi:MAG: sodium:proton antiporter [Clostridia bacterium BRH_c25]|nr:MAG: sodium:proton antiporter [Clostridia bacterium BRH_c25]
MTEYKADFNSYLIFAVSLALIGLCILLNVPLYFGFAGAVAFSAAMLVRQGHKLRTLNNMMLKGIKDCSTLFIIIVLIGATVSIWLSSGIVPTLMYYGFEYIKHINYILACFLVTAIISVLMGTAIGTVSTIGIALIGIGKGFAIPEQLLLGAVVSGAFVADRISPIAGLVNLMLKTTDLKYREYAKSMLNTIIPSLIIAASAYYFIGKGYMSAIDTAKIAIFQGNISSAFLITPVLLLLPLVVMIMAVCGVKPIINMSVGVAGGSIISVFLQKKAVSEVFQYILSGYKSATGIEELDKILRGGGVQPMIEVLLIVAGAVALSSLLEGTNILNPVIANIMDRAKTKMSLIVRTAAFSSLLTIATCDQTAGIILLGRLLKKRYEELGVNKLILARTIADTGTTIAPLIPWNVNSILILAITGVSALQYAPYAVLCYTAPLIAVLSGCFRERGKMQKNIVFRL